MLCGREPDDRICFLGARLEGALEQGAIVTIHFNISFRVVDELPILFAENDSFSSRRIVLTSPWPESLLAFERARPRLPTKARVTDVDPPGFGRPERPPNLFSPARSALSRFGLACYPLSRAAIHSYLNVP